MSFPIDTVRFRLVETTTIDAAIIMELSKICVTSVSHVRQSITHPEQPLLAVQLWVNDHVINAEKIRRLLHLLNQAKIRSMVEESTEAGWQPLEIATLENMLAEAEGLYQ